RMGTALRVPCRRDGRTDRGARRLSLGPRHPVPEGPDRALPHTPRRRLPSAGVATDARGGPGLAVAGRGRVAGAGRARRTFRDTNPSRLPVPVAVRRRDEARLPPARRAGRERTRGPGRPRLDLRARAELLPGNIRGKVAGPVRPRRAGRGL